MLIHRARLLFDLSTPTILFSFYGPSLTYFSLDAQYRRADSVDQFNVGRVLVV
jgi:hypothetical protein